MNRRIRVLFRLAALLVAFHLSGTLHTVLDTIHLMRASAEHLDDCEQEGDCKSCPPGCPGCHCATGGYSAPPLFDPRKVLESPADSQLIAALSEQRVPDDPFLGSIYRPPERRAGRPRPEA